jgi:hypothetical protein
VVVDRGARAHLAALGVIAALPALSVAAAGGGFLAHPGSEIAVRVWSHETFWRLGLLGAMVPIGAPDSGPLNNPDVVGSVLYGLGHLVLGRAAAYNLAIVATLWADMAAAWWLAHGWLRDRWAATVAAVGIGLAPYLLTYGVDSAITDQLHLWPWLLAAGALHRATLEPDPALGPARSADAGLVAMLDPAVRWGLLAGLCVGIGFVACPYNAVIAIPGAGTGVLGALLAWRGDRARLGRLARATLAALAACVVVAGPYAIQLRSILATRSSEVAEGYVDGTRHAPPWPGLAPNHPSRYAAKLYEYVAVRKESLIVRETGSRYVRTMAEGFALLALAGLAAIRGPVRGARAWAAIAFVGAAISIGPYAVVSRRWWLEAPLNPFYRLAWHLPGGSLILESFRYGVLVVVGVALAAAAGVAALRARGGVWRHAGLLALAVTLAEVAFVSPVPVPLDVARLTVPDAYRQLDTILPPGAILELPFFEQASGRFARAHFLHQLEHGRPIGDGVQGYPPRLYMDNPLVRNLLYEEMRGGPHGMLLVAPVDVTREREALHELQAAGFVGVVVDPAGYWDASSILQVIAKLRVPVTRLGDRLVFRLDEHAAPVPLATQPGEQRTNPLATDGGLGRALPAAPGSETLSRPPAVPPPPPAAPAAPAPGG